MFKLNFSSKQKQLFKRLYTTSKDFIESESSYQVTTYARPNDLVITRGTNCYLYDDFSGKKYVDFTSGIAVTGLGHSNPQIAQLLYDQAKKLVHCSNLYYNDQALILSDKLVEKTQKFGGQYDISKVFLCNSGSEANEAALKFVKKFGIKISEDRIGIAAFENSFHGRTCGSLSVTYNPKYRTPFGPLVPGAEFFSLSNEGLESLKQKFESGKFAGCIIEPIQGEGGVYPIPIPKLVELKQLCQANNVVLIYDEIQCGMGRSGKLWAHSYLPKEAHPDIFTVAKALGNGFPVAATCINEKINNILKVGDHGTTYGGNPLACRVANYVLDVIGQENFLQQVNEKGAYLVARLNKLKEKYPALIKEIRGKGLIIGCELTQPPNDLVNKCRENGLLIITAGKSTLRFVPALIIEKDVLDEGLDILEKSIGEVFNKK
ncbi:probable Acetylornithine aminotransferase, mitochondrial [Saccharomycodes ludwigii]|uniref:Acetylornithine aminotransferase, mitochondrial n=1 Tax=Saccharomycodes ludwigii TaxID=36035 RepID=A0A376B440_9ASCO|nr:hypothetical protein SCDLUD_004995 [Saccharomycodes ludwigii]KAH3898673.1 hypothetical protein SCDLUD_004995 [Saccharomycodes ludwigii]SSD59254.1 probable Acetylornithine aminotransferase, mitochondrial [Saccharomycodes ludwigii]